MELGLKMAAPYLAAQEPYKLPPKDIINILDAPPTPRVSMSPVGDWMLLILMSVTALPILGTLNRRTKKPR